MLIVVFITRLNLAELSPLFLWSLLYSFKTK